MRTPTQVRNQLFDNDPPVAYVIVVERENLDEPDKPGITEVYGPFTRAEAEDEAFNDGSATLFDPILDRINCVEWTLLPLIFPNWIDE